MVTESFEKSPVPPPVGSTEFSLNLWGKVRSLGIEPTFHGPLSEDDELRREFLVGARMMGYELVDLEDADAVAALRAMKPARYALQPQQLWMVDALNGGSEDNVVEVMRRASKTTTIFCWILGRCACRDDYQATFSAQSGVKSTARLREWKTRLDRFVPDPERDIPPWKRGQQRTPRAVSRHLALFGDDELTETAAEEPTTRGFRIMMGEVGKGIYFDNGSQFLVLKPDAEAYRGEAGDVCWIDEAQELDPEEGADLLAGLLPLQDTKDDPCMVVSGTAGEARVGPLWERVSALREGSTDYGGVDYCAPEDTDWELIEDEDSAMELLVTIHPGIGTLTTIEKMRTRWRKLDRPKWAREYLSLWPKTAGDRAVPVNAWEAGAHEFIERPARVAFGYDIKPGGSVAAIVAAWRDADGIAYVEVVDHRPSTDWMPGRGQELTARYRGSTLAYDDIAEGKATATEMQRVKPPRPKLRVQTYRETAAGCVTFLRDLNRGRLKHFNQAGMNTAVEGASRREVRSDQGVWLFTPGNPKTDDVTCLMAAVRALRNWDQHMANGGNRLRPSTGEAEAA